MNFKNWFLLMYEIATVTLSRVSLRSNPGLVGLVLQQDMAANTIQVHWGWDNGKAIQTWHPFKDVFPHVGFSKEMTNGTRYDVV